MALVVGKHFKSGITQYEEGIRFDTPSEGCCSLIFSYENPTKLEIFDITSGDVQYGYYKDNNVIIMLFRFGNQKWVQAPYSIHLSKNPSLKKLKKDKGYTMNVYIVNATNGILEGIRLVHFNVDVSKMLEEDIIEQRGLEFNDFENNINFINSNYSTLMLVSMSRIIGSSN